MTKAAKKTLDERRADNPPCEPAAHHPGYVHACHEKKWTFRVRHTRGEKAGANVPYTCGSRHHAGPCRDQWCRRLFGRITDPASVFKSASPDAVMFWTFTLPPKWHSRFPGIEVGETRCGQNIPSVGTAVPFDTRLDANRILGKQLRSYMQGLNKKLKRRGQESVRYFWIREDHKSGVPHLHLLVVHAELAAEVRERDALQILVPEEDKSLAPATWIARAVKCGFGVRFDAQLAHDREGLAGYVTKVMARLSGEVTKQGQVAERLPASCRSYGYSRGFIPPPAKRDEWTGWIDDEHGRKLSHRGLLLRALRESTERDKLGPVWGRIYCPQNPLASWDKGNWKDAAAIACEGAGAVLGPARPPSRVYRLKPKTAVSRNELTAEEVLGRVFRSNRAEVRALPEVKAGAERHAVVGMDDDYVRRVVRACRE